MDKKVLKSKFFQLHIKKKPTPDRKKIEISDLTTTPCDPCTPPPPVPSERKEPCYLEQIDYVSQPQKKEKENPGGK